MGKGYGETHWVIPDGYIPPASSGRLVSHESICVLNTGELPAELRITVYFEDREPLKDIPYLVMGERTKHIRTESLNRDGEAIPHGVPYALEVTSNVPVIVQYSRLDSTQAENALMTAMGYPVK